MEICRPTLALAPCFLLFGCTTLAAKLELGPPGVNVVSFRECLLDRGFYSPRALTGIAAKDWQRRHGKPPEHDAPPWMKPAKPLLTREELLYQKPAAFVFKAAAIISDGLMPALEYDAETGPPFPDAKRGSNPESPYRNVRAPDPYPWPGTKDVPDNPGSGRNPQPDWRLNRFLDCYIGPVGPNDGSLTAGDSDVEGRLLRGHILLALLSKFGTELVLSHPSRRQVAQAELLLGHIADAETSLRSASLVMNDPTAATYLAPLRLLDASGNELKVADGQILTSAGVKSNTAAIAKILFPDPNAKAMPVLLWRDYTTRLLRIFQVGVDIERIDTEQTLDRAANLLAAFSGALKGFLPILQDGLNGVMTVQKTRIYADAYLRDARQTLSATSGATSVSGTGMTYDVKTLRMGWTVWDDEIISACKILATVAKKSEDSIACIPKPGASAAPASQ
jgi:hypothetical protein